MTWADVPRFLEGGVELLRWITTVIVRWFGLFVGVARSCLTWTVVGLVHGIGGFARNEVRARRLGNGDRTAQLGSGCGKKRPIMGYLERLPGTVREVELRGGSNVRRCTYSPHSLRATRATLPDLNGELWAS